MRFSSMLVTGIALVSSAFACPTTGDIQKWLQDNRQVGDNTVFYNGKGLVHAAERLAEAVGGAYWGTAYPDVDNEAQYLKFMDQGCTTPAQQNSVIPNMSEALAEETTGTAYVLLIPGSAIAPESIWVKKEYPALQRNGVTVIAVNGNDITDQKAYDGNTNF